MRSRSSTSRPSSASRTGPPTSASSWPAASKRRPRSSATAAWAVRAASAGATRSRAAGRRRRGGVVRGRDRWARRDSLGVPRRGYPHGMSGSPPSRAGPRAAPRPEPRARRAPRPAWPGWTRRAPAASSSTARGAVPRAALIARHDRRGRLVWSLPKGHVEAGETPADAAVREVEEETGIRGGRPRPARHHRLLVRRRPAARAQDGPPLPARGRERRALRRRHRGRRGGLVPAARRPRGPRLRRRAPAPRARRRPCSRPRAAPPTPVPADDAGPRGAAARGGGRARVGRCRARRRPRGAGACPAAVARSANASGSSAVTLTSMSPAVPTAARHPRRHRHGDEHRARPTCPAGRRPAAPVPDPGAQPLRAHRHPRRHGRPHRRGRGRHARPRCPTPLAPGARARLRDLGAGLRAARCRPPRAEVVVLGVESLADVDDDGQGTDPDGAHPHVPPLVPGGRTGAIPPRSCGCSRSRLPPREPADGVFLDDHLATEVSATGRLTRLLDAAARAPGAVSWVVDPALLQSPAGHGRRLRRTPARRQPRHRAPARPAAQAWLDPARALTASAEVTASAYGDPDVVALHRAGLDVDIALASTTARDLPRQRCSRLPVGHGLAWPPGGVSRRRHPRRPARLGNPRGRALGRRPPPVAPGHLHPERLGRPRHGRVAAARRAVRPHGLAARRRADRRRVAGDPATANPVERRQQALAEIAMTTLELPSDAAHDGRSPPTPVGRRTASSHRRPRRAPWPRRRSPSPRGSARSPPSRPVTCRAPGPTTPRSRAPPSCARRYLAGVAAARR